jgi:hypothetical protein
MLLRRGAIDLTGKEFKRSEHALLLFFAVCFLYPGFSAFSGVFNPSIPSSFC